MMQALVWQISFVEMIRAMGVSREETSQQKCELFRGSTFYPKLFGGVSSEYSNVMRLNEKTNRCAMVLYVCPFMPPESYVLGSAYSRPFVFMLPGLIH